MLYLRTLCCSVIGVLTLVLLSSPGCERKPKPAGGARLQVLAAASLADAFHEVGTAFQASHPGTKFDFSFAGSNQLRTQLENGGPGDVFASADRKQMDAAVASKVVDPATVRVFAHNRLALIVPRENRAGIKELADLARPGLKVVVADKAVPVGNYTRQMLDKAGESTALGPAFVQGVEANIASREENVAAVVAKVALNEADAGIAYVSDAAGSNGPKLTVIPLPPGLEQRADYVVAVTARAADAKLAELFVEFLTSKPATTILEKRGFEGPGAGVP
jgi:molybdate transport system substrate-binding protein